MPRASAAGHPVPPDEPSTAASSDKTPWRHVALHDLVVSGELRLPFDLETTYKGRRLHRPHRS